MVGRVRQMANRSTSARFLRGGTTTSTTTTTSNDMLSTEELAALGVIDADAHTSYATDGKLNPAIPSGRRRTFGDGISEYRTLDSATNNTNTIVSNSNGGDGQIDITSSETRLRVHKFEDIPKGNSSGNSSNGPKDTSLPPVHRPGSGDGSNLTGSSGSNKSSINIYGTRSRRKPNDRHSL